MSQALLDPGKALDIIRAACAPLPAETCASMDALGRTLAQPVTAPSALPPFDNSAMDGFALAGGAEPLASGSEWPIEGEQAAGDASHRATGGAWAIMTGARVPEGLDRVIPVERTESLDDPPRVRLLAAVARGQNIRHAGTDVAAGEAVLAAGTTLAPQHLMLLAALGVAEVTVAQRPRMAVLNTGRELVDDLTQPLGSGEIRNSNGPFLAARIPRAGADLMHMETVHEDAVAPFLAAVERACTSGAHVVLSTGAVSMGRYDFVPQALKQLNADLLFHKLAIRPGKPLLFARLPDGTLFFGLPGNPIAVAVGLRFFVEPALRVMFGLPPEQPWRVALADAFTRKPPLRLHLKSRVAMVADGRLVVTILPGQQSYRIRPLADANAWVVLPVEATDVAAGTLVDVYGLGHLESPLVAGASAVGPSGPPTTGERCGAGAVGPSGPPATGERCGAGAVGPSGPPATGARCGAGAVGPSGPPTKGERCGADAVGPSGHPATAWVRRDTNAGAAEAATSPATDHHFARDGSGLPALLQGENAAARGKIQPPDGDQA